MAKRRIDNFPKNIAKYEIIKILGRGAMGVVYEGFDEQIERKVAIKVLHKHLLEGEQGDELLKRFRQEAKAAARCLHQNIVSIFDFGFHDEQPYIVMEYVDGVELRAQLQCDEPYSLAVATDITIQILKALQHAHSKGIVHRDIKPSNIILLGEGEVKVTDFGVARIDTSELTSTGYMIGTPNYMSPEALQGMTVDHRSDLYAVGVVFYELLTHALPVRGLSVKETLESLDSQSHLSVQNINSVKVILEKALHPHADGRFKDAKTFVEKLKNIDDLDLTDAKTGFYISPAARTMLATKIECSSQAWSPELLDSLEQSLAKYVGPMAHYIVKKTCKSSESIEALSESLSKHIPTTDERNEFLKNFHAINSSISQAKTDAKNSSKSGSQASTSKSAAQQTVASISSDEIERVAKALAYYVGPMASRICKKAAKNAPSSNEFFLRAAQNIPNSNERDEFLKKVKPS